MKKIVLAVALMCFYGSELLAQEITAFPSALGIEFYQDQKKLNCKEVDALMLANPASETYWRKSKKNALGGMIFGAVNFGAGIWAISNEVNNKPITEPMIAFGASALIGSIFGCSALKNKKLAILNYNDSLGKEGALYLVPEINSNGVGLALKF